MPILPNQRHEMFAQAVAHGKTLGDAYVIAGYRGNRGNASMLKAREDVSGRIIEIQSAAAKRVENSLVDVTLGSILQELDEARELAISLGQPAAAAAASLGKAKLAGLIIDRKETGLPGEFKSLEGMTVDELRAFVRSGTSQPPEDGLRDPEAGDPGGRGAPRGELH